MAENPSNNMMYNASYVEDEMRDPNAVITDGVSPYNMQDMMSGGVGRYVACELLIGTNNIALRHGVLTQVGPSYFILHNPVANHSTACDLYALKFVTFYPEGEIPAPQDIDRFLRTRVYYSPGQEAVPLSSTVRHTNNMRPYFEPHPEYGVSPFYRTGRHEGYTDESRPADSLAYGRDTHDTALKMAHYLSNMDTENPDPRIYYHPPGANICYAANPETGSAIPVIYLRHGSY